MIFHDSSCSILGFFVSSKMVKAILEWPEPTNMDEAHSFHGLATFYRAFLSNIISKIMAPIAYCMKKVQFSWTGQEEKLIKK